GAGQDAGHQDYRQRQAVVLEQQAGHVAGDAREGGLPEGEQPGIAQQQVEGQGEDREDQDLGRDGVAEQERQEDAGAEQQGQDPERHQRVPNSPWGRSSSTTSMTAKLNA